MTPAPHAAGRVESAPTAPSTWTDHVARLLGACEVALGVAGTFYALWLVVASVIPEDPKRAAMRAAMRAAIGDIYPHSAWDSVWTWVLAIFVASAAVAVLFAGLALIKRWPGRWWLHLLPLPPALIASWLVKGGSLWVMIGG